MPSIERCASPEEMPPLEPLSDAGSLHDSPMADSFPSGNLQSIVPRKRLTRLLGEVILTLKPGLVLENKGNVARDHLASERTFLAYMRTSLATSSAGVALVQLFMVSPIRDLSKFAKPLGGTIILFGLLILVQGVFRFFMAQHSLTRGHFPVARISITMIAFVLGSLVGIIFGILVAEIHH